MDWERWIEENPGRVVGAAPVTQPEQAASQAASQPARTPEQRQKKRDLEGPEQKAFTTWRRLMAGKHPCLKWMFHTPNLERDRTLAKLFAADGVEAGIPDNMLPAPRCGWMGLAVELKVGADPMRGVRQGRLSADQRACLLWLRSEGWLAVTCDGWVEASEITLAYVEGDRDAVEQLLLSNPHWIDHP